MASGQDKWSLRRGLMQNTGIRRDGKKQSPPRVGNTHMQKEVSQSLGNSHIERFTRLMNALTRASLKSLKGQTITIPSILEICDVALKIIFTTPVTKMEDVENCCGLICTFLTVEHKENKEAFVETLKTSFIKKLCERFMYKKRLRDLLNDRQISIEKKEKWLQCQYDMQGKLLKDTDCRSVTFLRRFFESRRAFVYQVIEALVRLPNEEEILYDFLNTLLKSIRRPKYSLRYPSPFRKNKELLERFQTIRKVVEEKGCVPPMTRMLLIEHWSEQFEEFKKT